MIKIGIIGCGSIAEFGHIPAIQKVTGLQLYALYDRDFSRATQLQRQFQIPHAYPTEEGFYSSGIDAVIICTPAPIHFKNVLDAAKYRKHVLCEKSFTGMYAELLKALQNETPGDMPTADDGIKATKIAKAATDQAIRERDKPSKVYPSTKVKAGKGGLYGKEVPMDFVD